MIDQELKKKIANTLSGYEMKMDKMQGQINALKHIIHQLVIMPGITYQQDEHFSQFQTELDAEFDAVFIEKKANRLANIIEKLEKKKAEKNQKIFKLIKQSTDTVARIANKSEDKRALGKLQKMILAEAENSELMLSFNEALSLSVSSILRELEDCNTEIKTNNPPPIMPTEISIKVNDSLQQLLDHLAIPQDLDPKRERIKSRLEKQLDDNNLSNVIDGLTELVVDAFNMEQNRFKGFLQQLTDQLQDFDVFLKSSAEIRTEGSDESRDLETGIQENIEQIKSHIDSSRTIEELSVKINQNLEMIGGRIKEYRENQKIRDEEYKQQVTVLKSRLAESEHNAEEIKSLLSFQKQRINHDSLTGLPNREAYNEHMSEIIQRWKKTGQALSLAVGDVDHFKRINDTFGHLAGDKVLRKVASIFKSGIRTEDFIARFGGEEFVLIFENTQSKAAKAILEKLRKAVGECQFVYKDKKVDVTVSFGLTSIVPEDTIESLFMRADNAMYQAKNAGRNRVEIL